MLSSFRRWLRTKALRIGKFRLFSPRKDSASNRHGNDTGSGLNAPEGIGAPDAPSLPAGSDGEGASRSDLLTELRGLFAGSDDVKFRDVALGDTGTGGTGASAAGEETAGDGGIGEGLAGSFVYIEGLVDDQRIELTLLRPLLNWVSGATPEEIGRIGRDVGLLGERIFAASEVQRIDNLEDGAAALLEGDVVFALQGDAVGVVFSNRGWQSRNVEAPKLEVTIRGPQEGFTENILWNTALLRRRVRDPHLRIQLLNIGRRSRTDVALVHIEGVTNDGIVAEVRRRLDRIDIDGILDAGYIEHLIEDEWLSPFPQHLKTERPDTVAAGLLEGRVAVFTDTTPFVLMMPGTLDSMFHSPEDSYDRWFPVNFLRFVRFIASIISVTAPGLYVALVAYHPGILPTEAALRLMATREGVAFPVVVETLLMQFFLELIKEAGFRMPSPIGQTFGIVGGLILGEMGVRAGIVSEAMVIIVAITAVSSFAAVDREVGTVLRLLGLPVMFGSALLGLYGFMLGVLLIVTHLVILRSYGVPFVAPYPYYRWWDMQDTLIKMPIRSLRRRPSFLSPSQDIRLRTDEVVGDEPEGKGDRGDGPIEGQ